MTARRDMEGTFLGGELGLVLHSSGGGHCPVGEIAAAIGDAEGREIAPVSLNYPLGFIGDKICRPKGLPWLNALAVNTGTWFPGDSFLPEGVAFGQDERVL